MGTLCSNKHHALNGRIQAGKTQKPWHKLLPPWEAPSILQKLVRFYCNWMYICFLNKALSPKEELNFLLHNTQHLEHSRQSKSVSWRKDGIVCITLHWLTGQRLWNWTSRFLESSQAWKLYSFCTRCGHVYSWDIIQVENW